MARAESLFNNSTRTGPEIEIKSTGSTFPLRFCSYPYIAYTFKRLLPNFAEEVPNTLAFDHVNMALGLAYSQESKLVETIQNLYGHDTEVKVQIHETYITV